MDGLTEELRAQKAYAGRLGALTNLARYGSASVGRRLYEGKRARYAAEIDPHGLLTVAEREQRVNYRIRQDCARMSEIRRRRQIAQREQSYGRTEDEMNRSIEFIARPPVVCVYCTPRSEWPDNASGGICAECAAKALRHHAA